MALVAQILQIAVSEIAQTVIGQRINSAILYISISWGNFKKLGDLW
jgi:hypothetical protein